MQKGFLHPVHNRFRHFLLHELVTYFFSETIFFAMSLEEDDDVCMTCGDGGNLTLCDLCDGPFHSLGCEYPNLASTNDVCYCWECQTIVFTQHQTMYTEHGTRERRLQEECLATNQVVYLQQPSSDHAVPFQVALDKMRALKDYVHVEPYRDGNGQSRFLIVGKPHNLNEAQAWNAVSFICTILNIPMYLEPLPGSVRSRVEAYKNRDGCTWFSALKKAQSESGEYNKFRFIPQFQHDTCDNVVLEDCYIKCICNEPIRNIFFRRIQCFDFTTGGVCNSYTVRNSRRPRGQEPTAWAFELFQVLLSVIERYGIARSHNHGLNRRVRRFVCA